MNHSERVPSGNIPDAPVVDKVRIEIDIHLPRKQKPKMFIESTEFLCDTLKEYVEHWLSLCSEGEEFGSSMVISVHVSGGGRVLND